MSAIIAFLLMQAAPAADNFKIYPSAEGFSVISGEADCMLLVKYNNGVWTTLAVSKESNEAYFLFNNENWQPVAGKRYDLKIDFDDWYYDLTFKATETGGFITDLHPNFLDTYAGAGGVTITWGGKPVAQLDLKGSTKAVAALRLCMKEKGIRLHQPPEPVAPKLLVKTDPFDLSAPAKIRHSQMQPYPTDANGAEGIVKASVKVSASAEASDCTILVSSDSALLDATACMNILRSRFTAAKDRSGQPTDGVVEHQVRFEDPSKTVKPY